MSTTQDTPYDWTLVLNTHDHITALADPHRGVTVAEEDTLLNAARQWIDTHTH